MAARVELANLELERKQSILVAPLDGIVTAGDVKVGDIIEAGKTVVESPSRTASRFEAFVQTEDVAHLHLNAGTNQAGRL